MKTLPDTLEGTGKFFGYPQCCIDEFVFNSGRIYGAIVTGNKELLATINKTELGRDDKINQNTGFIPCKHHAKMIQDGEITLESLISKRICSTEFPDDSGRD